MMNLMMDLLYAYVGVLCICGKGTLEMDSIITYLNLEWWFSPPPPPPKLYSPSNPVDS